MNYLRLAKIGMVIVRAMEPFCLIANALIFAASPMPPMPPLTCCTCARFGQLQRFDCIDARALHTFLRHLCHHWRRGTSYLRHRCHHWQERHFVTNIMPFFCWLFWRAVLVSLQNIIEWKGLTVEIKKQEASMHPNAGWGHSGWAEQTSPHWDMFWCGYVQCLRT